MAVRIATLHEQRAAFNRQVDEVRDADAAEIDVDTITSHRMLMPEERFRLLRDELALRRELAGYLQRRAAGLRKAHTAAAEAKPKAEADVRKALIRIGYIDAAPTQNVLGKIQPGYIIHHPKVIAAAQACNALHHAVNNHDLANANKAAIEEVTADLEHIKQRLIEV